LQLAEALKTGAYYARQLLFIGFATEMDQQTEISLFLPRGRMRFLRRENDQTEVAALGEALPMACDDTAWGRGRSIGGSMSG
jgi:phosphate transport system substrate-binding protein